MTGLVSSIVPFTVAVGPESHVSARLYEPDETALSALLILAHGAGAGQDHPFMVSAARGLAARGLASVTFNFPYMERRGKLPNPAPQLEACFRAVVTRLLDDGTLERRSLFIGGKSMGGRMASHLAASPEALPFPISGLVCLGYPLHPPGKPTQLRSAHLGSIRAPMLIVQGERDTFGTPAELRPVVAKMRAPVDLEVIEKADHSFKVAGVPREAQAARLEQILDRVTAWIRLHGAP